MHVPCPSPRAPAGGWGCARGGGRPRPPHRLCRRAAMFRRRDDFVCDRVASERRCDRAMRTHRAYVSFLMQKWGMGKQSRPVQTCVRRVLNQLNDGPLLALRDPRLEVMVRPDERRPVWAYFPIHRKRTVVRRVQPRAGTRVLLLFGAAAFEEDLGLFHHETGLTLAKTLEWGLAHTLGHVLLYLRAPRGRNDCKNAHMEWECAALGRNAQY